MKQAQATSHFKEDLMKLFDLLTDTGEREANAARIYGVVVGVVTNNEDPEGLGNVVNEVQSTPRKSA